MTFKAVVISKDEGGQRVELRQMDEAELMEGNVVVRVTHSALNYKDGLALTGRSPVVRRFPMVPGIDLAGVVESSDDPAYRAGDAVLLNGWGVGEVHLGGYAERARVRGDWLVPIPPGLNAATAMAIGTAGYTAMLCLMALEERGLRPSDGPALVTGAGGGVGSMAVSLLSDKGWQVIAATGRSQEEVYLRQLGASEILAREELASATRPLGKERWAAGVDVVGSTVLAAALSMTRYGGAIAACGLAGGMPLACTVAPFILRNVALLGIDSVMAPRARRIAAWNRLAAELDREKLATMTRTIALEEIVAAGPAILDGQVRGRVVVRI